MNEKEQDVKDVKIINSETGEVLLSFDTLKIKIEKGEK